MSNIELFQNGDNGTLVRQKINNSLSALNTDKTEKAANLSDLASFLEARSNLDVDSKAEVDAKITNALDALKGGASAAYDTLIELQNELQGNDSDIATILAEQADRLKISSNLSDLSNTASARTNLSVDSSSEVDSKITSAINNLKSGASSAYDTLLELQNAITSNDSDIATILTNQANKLDRSNNLSDLPSAETARTNLDVDKTILSRAMTASEYRALAEQRKNTFAGSGFIEAGLGYDVNISETINGLWAYSTPQVSAVNSLLFGNTSGNYESGDSKTGEPVANVNGTVLHIANCGTSNVAFNNQIKFPNAPDGLDKADGTGRFTDLNAAILAGGNDLSASVLKRQDLVLLESWQEKISEKDAVYPLGNVQYGASSWEGVTLSNTVVAQGYSAFGDWDTVTKGYGVKWSTLTAAQQATFINDPKNNIYAEDGELIQKRYRIRVIKGLGADWGNIDPANWVVDRHLWYSPGQYVIAQGSTTLPINLNSTGAIYTNDATSWSAKTNDRGVFSIGLPGSEDVAYKGQCHAIPIALVTRLNQGAYHPVFNPDGTTTWWDEARVASSIKKWHQTDHVVPDTADCFKWYADGYHAHQNNGRIGSTSGRPDGKFYDAIYADQVRDLRMSAHKISPQELLEVETRKAIAGEYRGWERVPYTKFIGETVTVQAAGVYDPNNNAGRFYFQVSAHDHPVNTQVLQALKADYWLLAGDNGNAMKIKRLNGVASDTAFWPNITPTAVLHGLGANDVSAEFNSKFPVGTKIWIGAQYYKDGDNYFETLPMTNIIGSPQKIVDLMTAKGWTEIQGEWIPTVPDGTSKEYIATRKVGNAFQYLFTSDNGSTWSSAASSTYDEYEGVSNSRTASKSASGLHLLSYTCRANGFELASNAVAISGSKVLANGNLNAAQLENDLLQHVSTNNNSQGGYIRHLTYNLKETGHYSSHPPNVTHDPLILNAGTGSMAMKCIPYITEDNGRYYQQCIYRELKHDGTDWGDDNTFTVIGNETVITDDNGNLVLVGQKRRALPYFKGGN